MFDLLPLYVKAFRGCSVTVRVWSNLLDFFVVILSKWFVLACAGSLWWFEAGWAKGRGWAAGQLPSLCVLYPFFSLSLCSLHHCIFLIRFFAGLQCIAISFHFMQTWVFIHQRPPPSLPGLTFLSSLHHYHFLRLPRPSSATSETLCCLSALHGALVPTKKCLVIDGCSVDHTSLYSIDLKAQLQLLTPPPPPIKVILTLSLFLSSIVLSKNSSSCWVSLGFCHTDPHSHNCRSHARNFKQCHFWA